MPSPTDLIKRGRMFEERAEQAADPISRQHYREMAAHYRSLAVEHQETAAVRSTNLSTGRCRTSDSPSCSRRSGAPRLTASHQCGARRGSLQNLIFESKARGGMPCEPSPSGSLISKDLDKYGVANFL
jgi:hypothetical protein